jgi:DNA uptake protein ComE-like DNA-binding protein
MLYYLPNMSSDLTAGILDWRSTNGGAFQTYYSMQHPPYNSKSGPFETVDELRMVYGATGLDILIGEDANFNGVLDANEKDENGNGTLDLGVLEYVTVYSREPNTNSAAGTALVNVRTLTAGSPAADQLRLLLQTNLDLGRADQILAQLLPGSTGAGRGRTNSSPGAVAPPVISLSPLMFYSKSGMTADEFAKIANYITVTNGLYIEGRVNINKASAAVLACLPGISTSQDLAQTLIAYRQSNPDKLISVAWIVDALGQNNAAALSALQAVDCITTQSFQFSADVAAIGPHGRGYRRVRFVIDTCEGAPKVIYRQDLSHLGWALGKNVRQTWLLAKDTR